MFSCVVCTKVWSRSTSSTSLRRVSISARSRRPSSMPVDVLTNKSGRLWTIAIAFDCFCCSAVAAPGRFTTAFASVSINRKSAPQTAHISRSWIGCEHGSISHNSALSTHGRNNRIVKASSWSIRTQRGLFTYPGWICAPSSTHSLITLPKRGDFNGAVPLSDCICASRLFACTVAPTFTFHFATAWCDATELRTSIKPEAMILMSYCEFAAQPWAIALGWKWRSWIFSFSKAAEIKLFRITLQQPTPFLKMVYYSKAPCDVFLQSLIVALEIYITA